MREGRAEWKTDRWTGAAIVSITDTAPICCVKECTEYKSQLRWFGQLIKMSHWEEGASETGPGHAGLEAPLHLCLVSCPCSPDPDKQQKMV